MASDVETLFEELRPLMFSIAYRMVGSVSEAEDIVQEAFLRFHRSFSDGEAESPKAVLSTITTRLAIDHLRSARVRRERYFGTWLPEPLVTDAEPDVVERAVFLLHEVFDYGYDEVASMIGRSEDTAGRSRFARAGRSRPASRGSRP